MSVTTNQLREAFSLNDAETFSQGKANVVTLPPPKEHEPLNTLADRQMKESVRSILAYLGEDPERPGLKHTPERVARFYREFRDPEPFNLTTFDADGYDEMIVQGGIRVYSLCEHHLLPFFGTAAVAYLPDRHIVGLSKLARLVRHVGSRPQNQERLTQQVATTLHEALEPQGVGVVLKCRHLCMEMRGVRTPETETTTSCLVGAFREVPSARAELLSLL